MSDLDNKVEIVRELYPAEDTADLESLQYYLEEQFDEQIPLEDLTPYMTIDEEDIYLQRKHLGL